MSSDQAGRHAAPADQPPGSGPTAATALAAHDPGRHAQRPSTVGDRVRTGVRGVGQTCITLGLVVLLFIVYELWFTDYINAGRQEAATNKLEQTWKSGDDPLVGSGAPALSDGKIPSIPLGTGIAIIRIPRLGLSYARTIVEGTNTDDLDIGPGHYVGSALPGQKGDFAVAGHRVGKGSPFLNLDKLRPGDAIVIETKTAWLTYRVLGDPATGSFTTDTPAGIPGREIVDPGDIQVIAPVPDHVGQTPTQAMITLTTCHPKFSARQRMIIHGLLDGKPRPRSAGPPPALRAQS